MLLSLPVRTPSAPKRKRKEDPVFPRPLAFEVARRVLSARSLRGAALAIKAAAMALPSKSAWHHVLLKLARALSRGRTFNRIFQLDGNSKLPFASFSSFPVLACPGAGECTQWCYSLRAWRTPEPYCRQLQNSLILRFAPELVEAAFTKLPHGITLRLYVDGDFSSAADVAFWMGALRVRPDIQVYGYSKSWEQLWEYGQANAWPENYTLNLSSGGRPQRVTKAQMLTLPITRGEFIAVHVNYRPAGVKGNIGFKRYADPAYHRAVRAAAAEAGLGKVFSCPGNCGECTGAGHLCGLRNVTVPVVIGVH